MKKIKASFYEMLVNTSVAVQQEVCLEFTISNRISALMTEWGPTQLQFAQTLGKKAERSYQVVE